MVCIEVGSGLLISFYYQPFLGQPICNEKPLTYGEYIGERRLLTVKISGTLLL